MSKSLKIREHTSTVSFICNVPTKFRIENEQLFFILSLTYKWEIKLERYREPGWVFI